jgi:hypothetical protein
MLRQICIMNVAAINSWWSVVRTDYTRPHPGPMALGKAEPILLSARDLAFPRSARWKKACPPGSSPMPRDVARRFGRNTVQQIVLALPCPMLVLPLA